MDTYDMEVECGMYCQGGSVKGVLEPYGYGSWVKVEDAESLTAERDRLSAENAKLQSELAAEVDARDAVITKLLDLIAPHIDEFGNCQWWHYKRPEQLYHRACEIAGREE